MRERRRVAPGIFVIDGQVYAEVSKDRRVHRRKAPMQGSAALNTNGRPTRDLMEWFRQFQCQVINAQWEALKESRQRRPRTSIEEAVAAYREFAAAEYARSGTPRPASVKSNVNALLNISDRVGARMVDELTPQRSRVSSMPMSAHRRATGCARAPGRSSPRRTASSRPGRASTGRRRGCRSPGTISPPGRASARGRPPATCGRRSLSGAGRSSGTTASSSEIRSSGARRRS